MAADPAPPSVSLEPYVREAAALAGLELTPAQLSGVVEAYGRLAALGALLMSFPLDETDEPAPVHRP